MSLSDDLISQFVKETNTNEKPKDDVVLFGTIKKQGNSDFVQLDGSEMLTPISSTTVVRDGDRVTVKIQNHAAIVTGNITAPSVSDGDLDGVRDEITEMEIVIAGKVSTEELDAEKGRIDDLIATDVLIKETLTATEIIAKDVQADNVVINNKLTATEADILELNTKKLDADVADIKYATIGSLEATDIKVHNLESDYGDFKVLTTDKFTANDASINKLETEKLSATDAELKYANIDFTNIGKAAIEYFYATSGLIKDVVIGDGTITGNLVGVTIKGDIIEGGTIVAEKLVIKGEDGLYYKLNTDGVTIEAEQTDHNSLNGSIITAKSITASKVNVNDLVAFDATIGGFNITDKAIYSGVKETVNNTTRGIYLDKDGQMALGDASNYLKFFKDVDGKYKLAISASELRLSSSDKTVEEVIDDSIDSSEIKITESYTSLIEETSKEINLMISKLTEITDGQDTTISDISNRLQITAEMAQFVKTTTERLQSIVDGKISTTEIQEWARFDGANLELGVSNSPFKCRLSNTELGFYQGENKVAWLSNNELHVLTAVIATSIGCGNFMFVDEGALGFSLI